MINFSSYGLIWDVFQCNTRICNLYMYLYIYMMSDICVKDILRFIFSDLPSGIFYAYLIISLLSHKKFLTKIL